MTAKSAQQSLPTATAKVSFDATGQIPKTGHPRGGQSLGSNFQPD